MPEPYDPKTSKRRAIRIVVSATVGVVITIVCIVLGLKWFI